MEKPLNIVLLGRSGSGKGTQARLLCEKFNLKYIGTGDLLRKFSKRESTLSKRLREELKEGRLLPAWLPMYLWINELIDVSEEKGVLFDGSPRRSGEAQIMEEVLDWYGRTNLVAILVDVSREEVEKRLLARRVCSVCSAISTCSSDKKDMECEKCGGKMIVRPGDNKDGIKERMDWFDNEVTQNINFYEKKGILLKVNGEQSPDKVFKEIIDKINSI